MVLITSYNELVTGANLNQLISSIQNPIETPLKSINIAISWGLTVSPPQDPNWATVRLPPTPRMAIVPRAEPLRLTRNLQARKSQGWELMFGAVEVQKCCLFLGFYGDLMEFKRNLMECNGI